jgi:hypothetical protein
MNINIGILSVTIAGLALLVSFLGLQFTRQKEDKTDTQQDAQIKAQLQYISKGVDDIRIDQKANEKQIGYIGERVTRLEESTKSAHKRIDTLEKESILK